MNRICAVFALCFALLVVRPSFAQDMIPVGQVTFVGPGGDVGAFPITASISRVTLGRTGVNVEFSKKEGPGRWPNTCGPMFVDSPPDTCREKRPDGTVVDMGPLEYSVGVVLNVNGQLFASAPMEFWNGLPEGGGQIQDQSVTCPSGFGQLHCNWFYDQNRWPHLYDARPAAGSTIGIFVVAGDARNNFFLVQERSNIVTMTLPQQGVEGVFDFPAFAPAPVPTPVPQPVPTPVPVPQPPTPQPVPTPVPQPVPPAPLPASDLTSFLLTQQAVNQAALMAQFAELKNQVALVDQHMAEFREAVKSKWLAVVNNPIFKYGLAAVTGFLATHKWGG